MSAYVRAVQLIGRHRLWPYVWAPALLGLLLGAVVLRVAYTKGDNIGHWLLGFYPWEWGREWMASASQILGSLLVVVLGLLLFRYIIMAVSSPLMSLLSEKLEYSLYPHRPAPAFSMTKVLADLVRGIRIALRNIVRELFFTLILLLVGVIIPILSPFTTVAIFLLQSYYAGFGNMDYTLERRLGVSQSVGFVRRHRGMALGNGIVFVLLLMTLVGFIIALPLGTIAAATETLSRLDADEPLNR